MIRSSLFAALGVLSIIGMGALPLACQSGGVGDPCIPEDEYNPQFAGYKVTEENIESRSFQCQTRICLVNHFQGRVSCPYGQPPLDGASGRKRQSCGPKQACPTGEDCVEAATLAPDCTVATQKTDCQGYGGVCHPQGLFCECGAAGCPEGFFCDAKSLQCKSYVCHTKGSCQTSGSKDGDKNKDCCIPGTDTPVVDSVCGQCDAKSNRNADDAVYCSCRCGVADGQPDDPNFNFCTCPTGYECKEIRKNVGISDPQITGKYCIKTGTAYDSSKVNQCQVSGYFSSDQCKGLAAQ
jgi:hypothetical protein